MLTLAMVAALFAGVPCCLYFWNVRTFCPLPAAGGALADVSVLIPARDEETNIAPCVESVLQSVGCEFELIVLDDDSTDNTAALVTTMAGRDSRVRLLRGRPLPESWRGKNFACQQLAEAARHPLLVFIDADVRITGADSLARIARLFEANNIALASGIPRQTTGTWAERLVVPLIHFVLLGFLPTGRMRSTTDPRFAAACGQLLAVRRDEYLRVGGHGAVANRVHDALALCRHFRARNLRTDLFEATDGFSCRMYHDARGVWQGFAKNAHEGLGSNRLIIPASAMLLLGQIAPFLLLLTTHGSAQIVAAAAALFSLAPRLDAAKRFRQSFAGAMLHPLGIALLLANQWWALFRRWQGAAVQWKGRDCTDSFARAASAVPQ